MYERGSVMPQSRRNGSTVLPFESGGSSENLALNVGRDFLMVTACGRSVSVPLRDAQSVNAVQAKVQSELKMHGQDFELFDCVGTALMTDSDLRMAIQQGRLPVTASLSESSVHFIENRREELSQMQWKLLRDKIDGVANKVDILGQQLNQVTDSLSNQLNQQLEGDRRLQSEMHELKEDGRHQLRQLGAQLSERVEAVSQLVHSERNMREALKEGIMRQLNSLMDALEAERTQRRSEIQSTHNTIQELRQAIEDEGRTRAALDDTHNREITAMQDRIDSLSRYQAEAKQDVESYMRQLTAGANKELEEHTRIVTHLRSGVEAAQVEVATRFQKLEDRSTSVENRLKETQNRHAQQHSQLFAKHKELHTTVEEVRLKHRGEQLLKVEHSALNSQSNSAQQSARVEEIHSSPRTSLQRPIEPIAMSPTVRSMGGSLIAPSGGTPLVHSSSQGSLTTTALPPGAIAYHPGMQHRAAVNPPVVRAQTLGVIRRH